jgi:Pyruvate/2-oxoacid:ferredoxin oxidoreductase gamma subunit
MLPDGSQRKFFYLSVDFARDPLNPKDEVHQQDLADKYPRIRALGVRGSENPNLLPKGAITVRMHSVGGWGAITTGKNLAMTLFELLGWDIKANPKYGSEKKGQPTTYYLSAAPEPIRINCEYVYVDVVLSPDPAVFGHSNPLSGLKKGGFFIIQSNLGKETWASFPLWAQKFIVDNEIRVFYLDAFQIAREEAGAAELQLRMQGIAFQGAFFAASPTMANAGLTEDALFTAIEAQLQSKFGGKGARVVADNLRVVRRGFTELTEITEKEVGVTRKQMAKKDAGLPVMLRQMPPAGAAGQGGRHPPLLGADRKLLPDRQGQRQPGRSLHRRLAGAGRHRRVPRHDRHPLRASGMDRRELHGLRQLLCRMPGLGDPRPGQLDRRRAQHGDQPHRDRRHADALPAPRRASIEKKLRALVDNEGGAVRPLFDAPWTRCWPRRRKPIVLDHRQSLHLQGLRAVRDGLRGQRAGRW